MRPTSMREVYDMDVQEFLALKSDQRGELIREALQCQGTDDLRRLAQEYGVDLTEEGAERLLQAIQGQVGELSDSELDAVTGGGGGKGRLCVRCFKWEVRMVSPEHCSNAATAGKSTTWMIGIPDGGVSGRRAKSSPCSIKALQVALLDLLAIDHLNQVRASLGTEMQAALICCAEPLIGQGNFVGSSWKRFFSVRG